MYFLDQNRGCNLKKAGEQTADQFYGMCSLCIYATLFPLSLQVFVIALSSYRASGGSFAPLGIGQLVIVWALLNY